MRLLLAWASNTVALWVAAALFAGVSYGGKVWALLVAGLVFGVVNAVVRPLVVLLALPAVILTLGVALLLVNALMLWLTDLIVGPFDVRGFWTTVGAALVVWVVNMALHAVADDLGGRRRRGWRALVR